MRVIVIDDEENKSEHEISEKVARVLREEAHTCGMAFNLQSIACDAIDFKNQIEQGKLVYTQKK